MKLAAFDLETAKQVPQGASDLKAHRPLGICCAAVLEQGAIDAHRWHSVDASGRHAPQMNQTDLRQMVRHLMDLVAKGTTLVTWNGLSFDFDILAEESGMHDECVALAHGHVDMMFHVVCDRGYPVSLAAACQGLNLPAKKAGAGEAAPTLWASGRCAEVIEYNVSDCRMTLAVAQRCLELRRFQWVTQRGKRSSFALARGWLTVADASRLPMPDVSWMSNPPRRESFYAWAIKRDRSNIDAGGVGP